MTKAGRTLRAFPQRDAIIIRKWIRKPCNYQVNFYLMWNVGPSGRNRLHLPARFASCSPRCRRSFGFSLWQMREVKVLRLVRHIRWQTTHRKLEFLWKLLSVAWSNLRPGKTLKFHDNSSSESCKFCVVNKKGRPTIEHNGPKKNNREKGEKSTWSPNLVTRHSKQPEVPSQAANKRRDECAKGNAVNATRRRRAWLRSEHWSCLDDRRLRRRWRE